MTDAAAIRVRGLRKTYGGLEALRGIDFDVRPGEVFGLLGPNGAGKTTTVEILEGYRERDGGDVRVLGVDPWKAAASHRERIGVVLQQSQLPPALTVREVHGMFAGYYGRPRDVDEVIELVGLSDKAGERVKTLSGGQKRRLDLGVALVGDPELVFLDEPTTGFDPSARRTAWELVRSLRSLGKTIVLTTHYLDEAQQLADRVAVIREGALVTDRDAGGADRRRAGCRDPLSRERPRGDPDDGRADAPARRADRPRARRGPRARSARGAPAHARGRLPGAGRRGRRSARGMRLFWHELRMQQLVFWRNRESAVFIFVFPADAVPAARRGLQRQDRRRPGGRPAARRDDGLRLREHRARGPRDHAGRPPRGRAAQARARDAAPGSDLPDGRARLDARRLPAADSGDGRTRA